MIPTTYIDWHCTACGFNHETETRSHSWPVKCAQCGAGRVCRDHPILPTNTASRDAKPRKYDLLGGEPQVQVYLVAATRERVGFTFDPDVVKQEITDDYDDPIRVAKDVMKAYRKHYLVNPPTIIEMERVLAAMRACEAVSERNRMQNRINELRKQIVCATSEYGYCVDVLAEPVEEAPKCESK